MSGRHHPFSAMTRPLPGQLAPSLASQDLQVANGSGLLSSRKVLPSISLPGTKLYVPGPHTKQNWRSLGRWTSPLTQSVQLIEPAFDCVAGEQSVQLVEPVADANLPAKQSMQVGCPVLGCDVPGRHDWQAVALSDEEEPTSHSMHLFPSPYVPAEQTMQFDFPVLGCDVPGKHN